MTKNTSTELVALDKSPQQAHKHRWTMGIIVNSWCASYLCPMCVCVCACVLFTNKLFIYSYINILIIFNFKRYTRLTICSINHQNKIYIFIFHIYENIYEIVPFIYYLNISSRAKLILTL